MVYNFQKFFKKYAYRCGGFFLALLSAFLTLSFLSYDRSDPSWNTAVEGVVQNLGGLKGAIWADLMHQLFGKTCLIGILLLGALGVQLLFTQTFRLFFLRLFCLPLTQWILSIFAASTIMFKESSGAIGLMSFNFLEAKWHLLPSRIHPFFLTLILFCFVCVLIRFIFALKFYQFKQSGQFLAKKMFDMMHYVRFIGNKTPNFMTSACDVMDKMSVNFKQSKISKSFDVHPNLTQTPYFDKNDFKQLEQDIKTSTNPFDSASLESSSSLVRQHNDFEAESIPNLSPSSDFSAIAETLNRQKPFTQPDIQKNSPQIQESIQRVSEIPKGKAVLKELDLECKYQLPALNLLSPPPKENLESTVNESLLLENARLLMSVLEDFGIRGEVTKVHPGPVVTLYELIPAPGIKASRVIGLADDIARSMSALSTRIAVIPGHNAIGIELPNKIRQTVYLQELLTSPEYEAVGPKLPLALGKNIGGEPVIADLTRMPHLLVAGTTGAGKSVAINTMILSLLYHLSPERCRFIMIDPKMLELSVYDGIPHLLSPVVTDPKKAVFALKWTVKEMEDRYRAMSKLGVRNIEGYNVRLAQAHADGEVLTRQVQTGFDTETGQPIFESQPLSTTSLPYIVVVVDEMADLMLVAGKDIETTVQRLAQMARAAGIHLIMATQRPSVDVITGTIKANFPTRISFQVTSRFDSRTILGEQGAEQLLGRGDMLYMEAGGKIQRVHGPFVSDKEVEHVVNFLKLQATPDYIESITEEDTDVSMVSSGPSDDKESALYQQALQLIRREQKASTSFVQRHLRIGYNSAARIIEQMENEGVISAPNHKGKRDVL
ncbi:MAG: DNA translocase FtsK 4TM domain-containing protein [Janthinobacterium lividum]